MIVKFLWFSVDLALVPKILIVYIFQNFHMYIWNVIIIFLGTRDLGCTASCCWSWLNPCTGDCGQCGGHSSECWFDNLLWWKRYLIHVVFFSDNDLYLIYVCPGFSCWKLISDFLFIFISLLMTSCCPGVTKLLAGAKYELPKYVLSEPTNLIRES